MKRVLAAAVGLGLGLGACNVPDPKPPVSPAILRTPTCKATKQTWTSTPPHADDEKIYGVGSGDSEAEALTLARRQAAESQEVRIVAESVDQQVDWSHVGSDGKDNKYESQFSATAKALVNHVLEGCQVEEQCHDANNKLWVLAGCFRRTALERDLVKAVDKLAKAVPENAVILLVPGTDGDGWITGLGEYAANVVRARIGDQVPASARLLRVPKWVPTDLHEVGRQQKTTHLIRIEHASAGEHRVRLTMWIQDVKTDQEIPGSSAGFEVQLAPEQLELLSLKGPLLPQKDAMELAANFGAGRVDLRLSSANLKEGENVEIKFKLDKDGYVYLFDLYEDGQAVMMVPSPDSPDNHFTAGEHVIPDENWKKKGDVLKACPIPGHQVTRENVKIIVSPTPLALIDQAAASHDMKTFSIGPSGDLSALVKKLNGLKSQGATFSDTTAPYFVQAVPDAKGCR